MKNSLRFLLSAAFVMSFFAFAFADATTTFYGYQWLRYDFQQYGGSYGSTTDTSNNTFLIPRTYLRWKIADPAAGYEGNITIDINNTNAGENFGNSIGAIDWASFLKFAYVDFTNIPFLSAYDARIRVGQQSVYFGTIDTWQYPAIESSIETVHNIVSPCDDGVSMVGKLPMGYGSYEAAVYNGTGYKDIAYDSTRNITDKAYDFSVRFTPIKEFYVRASYFHKLTSAFGATILGYNATALVAGGTLGPVEAFEEYVDCTDAGKYTAGSASGVSIGWESYLGITLTDLVELHLRIDTYDPDTRIHNNEQNTYIAGLNLNFMKNIVLQLDYELTENKFPFAGGAKDNNLTNNNQFISQLVWKW
jgi:opacity protein-like surface antigen